MDTTLNKLRSLLFDDEFQQVISQIKAKRNDEDIPLSSILDGCGLEMALICLRVVSGKIRAKRMFAIWCAKQKQYTEPGLLLGIDVLEKFAKGLASHKDLKNVYRYAKEDKAEVLCYAAFTDESYAACYAAEQLVDETPAQFKSVMKKAVEDELVRICHGQNNSAI